MAGILDFLGGAGSAFGDAASGVGGAIGDAGSALQNMAGSAVKAAQPAISGAGNWLMGSGEYTHPEAAMRRQAQLNMLMKLGGTLMAAGAYQSPESRAKQLARLGDVGTSYTSDLFKQQQAQLMAAQLKQQMSRMSALKSLDAMRKTDAGAARIAQQTGVDPSVVKSLPVEQLSDLQTKIAVRLAAQRANAAQMAQIMGPITGVGAGGSSAVSVAQPSAGPAAPATAVGAATAALPAESAAPSISMQTMDERAKRQAAIVEALKRATAAGNVNAVNALTKMLEVKSPYDTEGQKAIDKEFGTENYKWMTSGSASAKADLANLQFAKSSLEYSLQNGKPLTGQPLQQLASALGVTPVLFPNTQAVYDAVLSVAQKSLKEILGGQFAQKEGEEFLKRSFDPKLGVEENLRRIKILMGSVQSIADAKSAANTHFRKYGTLAQFYGQQFTSRSVLADLKRQFEVRPSGDKSSAPANARSPSDIIDFSSLK